MSTQANATESSAIKPALACLARVSLWQTPGAARAEQPSIVCAGIHPEYRSTVSTGHAPEHRQKAHLSARGQTSLGKVGSTYGYSLTGRDVLPPSLISRGCSLSAPGSGLEPVIESTLARAVVMQQVTGRAGRTLIASRHVPQIRVSSRFCPILFLHCKCRFDGSLFSRRTKAEVTALQSGSQVARHNLRSSPLCNGMQRLDRFA
jgi:hypothetical protein